MIWWSSNYKSLCKIDILVSSSAACKFFEFSSPRPTRYICCQGFLSIISTFILWVCLLVNWMATLGSQRDLLSFCRQTCRNCCVGQNNWLVQIGTYRLFTYLLVCVGWYGTWDEIGTHLGPSAKNQHSWSDSGWESWCGLIPVLLQSRVNSRKEDFKVLT